MKQYPTNLTDKQWQVTENILDPQHRKRKYPLRDIMNIEDRLPVAYAAQGLPVLQHRLLLLQQVEAGRRIRGTYGHAPSDGPQADGAQGTHRG